MPDFILSLHSYTKNYEGQVYFPCLSLLPSWFPLGADGNTLTSIFQPRKVEVGVLYKEDEELAKAMKKQFTENGKAPLASALPHAYAHERASTRWIRL